MSAMKLTNDERGRAFLALLHLAEAEGRPLDNLASGTIVDAVFAVVRPDSFGEYDGRIYHVPSLVETLRTLVNASAALSDALFGDAGNPDEITAAISGIGAAMREARQALDGRSAAGDQEGQ